MTDEERNQLIEAVQAALIPLLDQRFDGLDQRMDGLDQRIDGLDQRITSLSKDVIQPFISIAGRRHQELSDRVDRVEQIASAALASVQRLERGPIRRLLDDVTDIQSRLTTIEQHLAERGVLAPKEVIGPGERWVTWSQYRELEIRVRVLEEQIASYTTHPGEGQ